MSFVVDKSRKYKSVLKDKLMKLSMALSLSRKTNLPWLLIFIIFTDFACFYIDSSISFDTSN